MRPSGVSCLMRGPRPPGDLEARILSRGDQNQGRRNACGLDLRATSVSRSWVSSPSSPCRPPGPSPPRSARTPWGLIAKTVRPHVLPCMRRLARTLSKPFARRILRFGRSPLRDRRPRFFPPQSFPPQSLPLRWKRDRPTRSRRLRRPRPVGGTSRLLSWDRVSRRIRDPRGEAVGLRATRPARSRVAMSPARSLRRGRPVRFRPWASSPKPASNPGSPRTAGARGRRPGRSADPSRESGPVRWARRVEPWRAHGRSVARAPPGPRASRRPKETAAPAGEPELPGPPRTVPIPFGPSRFATSRERSTSEMSRRFRGPARPRSRPRPRPRRFPAFPLFLALDDDSFVSGTVREAAVASVWGTGRPPGPNPKTESRPGGTRQPESVDEDVDSLCGRTTVKW